MREFTKNAGILTLLNESFIMGSKELDVLIKIYPRLVRDIPRTYSSRSDKRIRRLRYYSKDINYRHVSSVRMEGRRRDDK